MSRINYKDLALYFGIAAILFATDGLIKQNVEHPERFPQKFPKYREGFIFNENIKLNYLKNSGAALSILKDNKEFLKCLSMSLTATGAGILGSLCLEDKKQLQKIGMSLLLAGGASNTVDRVTKGYVTDYFSINKGKKLKNIVFNISDFEIFIGSMLYSIGRCIEE